MELPPGNRCCSGAGTASCKKHNQGLLTAWDKGDRWHCKILSFSWAQTLLEDAVKELVQALIPDKIRNYYRKDINDELGFPVSSLLAHGFCGSLANLGLSMAKAELLDA